MPIHDWTRVSAGTFHAFHLSWLGELMGALNNGVLPAGFLAMAEQVAVNVGPDVLTLRLPGTRKGGGTESSDDAAPASDVSGGLAALLVAPQTRMRDSIVEPAFLAARRRRIVIRHASGEDAVALIEVVSPGNKSGRVAVTQFVDKAVAALQQGLHLQVLDLFPPRRADPGGLHAMIWAELGGVYVPPVDRALTLAAYAAMPAGADCYVEPTAVGLGLAELPLFLSAERYVNVPLEATYTAAFHKMPHYWREVLESAA